MFRNFSIERTLRTLHSWLGALILPWIFMAGLTGFYMNHEKLVLSAFPESTAMSGAEFFLAEGAGNVSQPEAMLIAQAFDPNMSYAPNKTTKYNGTRIFRFKAGSHNTVYVDRQSGGFWHLRRYKVTAYDRNGQKLGSELRWGRVFSSIHERGFVGESLGRWLADMTAIALMVFASSGLVLFASPRLRRRRNKRARLRAAQN
ncbi:MAG: PepSY-associated TM helix domain-containing protein [Paracoccaceae bacterium]|jgi:hypothetical protein|nr:PepSY-associated TM helix domain-containing protein [Paracoccaceae bacterium]